MAAKSKASSHPDMATLMQQKIRRAEMIDHLPAAQLTLAGLISDDPIVLIARVPLAPSTNALNANTSSHARRVKSSEARRFDQICQAKLAGLGQHLPGQHYKVTLIHTFSSQASFSRSDADNRIKQVLDSIAAAIGFNDSSVMDIRSIKAGPALFDEPATAIIIQTISHDPALLAGVVESLWLA